MTMTDDIRAAVDAIDRDRTAGTKKFSHTMQTRHVAAALRAIGLKRTEFRARVTYGPKQGGYRTYDGAIGSPHTREGAALVEQHAQALADAGFTVFLVGERSHFIGTGGGGKIVDHRS